MKNTSTISLKKVAFLSKYQFLTNWPFFVSIGATLLINLVIGLIHGAPNGQINDTAGSLDIVVFGITIFYGATMFGISFKFALVNGNSRNTFYLSSILTGIAAALVFSLFTSLMVFLSRLGGMTYNIYFNFFGDGNLAGLVFWMFAMTFLSISIGYLFAAFFYRTKRITKFVSAIILAFVGAILFLLFSKFPSFLAGFSKVMIFLTGAGENYGSKVGGPFIGMAFALLFGILFFALSYLFVRRCNIREK